MSQKKMEPPASISDQIKFTDLARHKTSVQHGFIFHFIENRQLFHREAARRAGVYSPGHSAHNEVPGAGGAHHSEHGRYSRRLPTLPRGTSKVVSVSLPPILTVDCISAPLRFVPDSLDSAGLGNH